MIYSFFFGLIGRISDRFDTYPQLIQLFTNPKTLRVLFSSLAVLSMSLATQIVEVLVKVLTHEI
jgi:hypothetical protein